MSVTFVKGVWRYQVMAHFNDGTGIRVSGRSPWDDNTEAGAKRAEAEHILWIASQAPSRKPKFRPTNRKSAFGVHHADPIVLAPAPTPPPPPTVLTLEEFLPTYMEHTQRKVTKSTFLSKQVIVREYLMTIEIERVRPGGLPPERIRLASLPLDKIDNGAIDDLTTALTKRRCSRYKAGVRRLQPSTVNNILNVLSNCLRYAKFRKLIVELPEIHRQRLPKVRPNFILVEERDRLFAHADDMWRVMFGLTYYCGLRRGELRGLSKDAVNLETRTLTIREAYVCGEFKDPKDHEPREVALCDDAVVLLKWWLPRVPPGQKLVFAENGRPVRQGKLQSQLDRACRLAGLPLISLRTLRHSFATHMADDGVPLPDIQPLMGHSDIRMTMRYVHSTPGAAHRAVARLNAKKGRNGGPKGQPAQSNAPRKSWREMRAERAETLGPDRVVQESLHKANPKHVTN